MKVWAFLMLVSGGLFARGVTALTWDRIPAWRSMALAEFRTDFAGVVQKADRVQPVLLVVAIVASFAFGLTDVGAPRILALIGASGFLVILIGSVAVLVPLQRRMMSSSSLEAGALERMRHRWFRGHLERTVVGVDMIGKSPVECAAWVAPQPQAGGLLVSSLTGQAREFDEFWEAAWLEKALGP